MIPPNKNPRCVAAASDHQARMRPQERAVLRAVRDEQRNVRKYGIARFNKRCSGQISGSTGGAYWGSSIDQWLQHWDAHPSS